MELILKISGISIWLLLLFSSSITRVSRSAEIEKLNKSVEMAIVLDDSGSIHENDFKHLLNVTRRFPDYLVMNNQSVRVALVRFSDSSEIIQPLTPNEKDIRGLHFTRERGGTQTHLGLKDVREKVFANIRQSAAKMVVLITDGAADDWDETQKEADALRAEGALIYILYIDVEKREVTRQKLRVVAGDPNLVIPIPNFDGFNVDLFGNLKDTLKDKIRCRFREVCRFANASSSECIHDWYQLEDEGKPCEDTKKPDASTKTLNCDPSACSKLCDDKWPWTKWPCPSNHTGRNMTMSRDETRSMEKVAWWCPKTQRVTCGKAIETDTDKAPGKSLSKWPWWWILVLIIALLVSALIIFAMVVVASQRRKRKMLAMLAAGKAAGAATGGAVGAPLVVPVGTPTVGAPAKSTGLAHGYMRGSGEGSVMASLKDSKVPVRGKKGAGVAALSSRAGAGSKDTAVQANIVESGRGKSAKPGKSTKSMNVKKSVRSMKSATGKKK